MYANTLAHNLMYSTIRLNVVSADSVGTGFYFGFRHGDHHEPAIITNNHVLPPKAGTYVLSLPIREASDPSQKFPSGKYCTLNALLSEQDVIRHPNSDINLCCFSINKLRISNLPVGFVPFYRHFSDEDIPADDQIFDAIESISMVGYPSGLYDETNNLPLVRRGITASPINFDFNGEPKFIVDIATFPGSSGSPVVICDLNGYSDIGKNGSLTFRLGAQRLILVGIIFSAPTRTEIGKLNINIENSFTFQNWMHLGVAIKSREIRVLEREFFKAKQF